MFAVIIIEFLVHLVHLCHLCQPPAGCIYEAIVLFIDLSFLCQQYTYWFLGMEWGSVSSLTFVSPFLYWIGYSGFAFPCKSLNWVLNVPEILCWGFNWVHPASLDGFRGADIVTLLNFPTLQTGSVCPSSYLVLLTSSIAFCSFPHINPGHILLDFYVYISYFGVLA